MWRAFRLFFLMVVFAAVTFFLVLTTPWQRWFGKPRSYSEIIVQGDSIVDAVYAFRAHCNLWPEYLDDLSPAYLSVQPNQHWYFARVGAVPTLSILTTERRTHVAYDFDPSDSGWRVWGETDSRWLRRDANRGANATQIAQDITERELAELDRRIAREPTWVEHRRAKGSLLKSMGRTTEARQVAENAAKELPEYFWPALAKASLDEDGVDQKGVNAFAAWVKTRPSFTHFYYLSVLQRKSREDKLALQSIEDAIVCSPELGSLGDDGEIPAFYFWDMARFALLRGEDSLVVQAASAWEKSQAGNGEASYLAVRAAAELHLGKQAAAQTDLDALATLKQHVWAKNIAVLRAAVGRNDRHFAYSPGDVPATYEIFSLPE